MRFIHEVHYGYNLTVVLPEGYNELYYFDVIYIHDSGKPASLAFNQIDHLIRTKQISPLIIVGIEPKNRSDDYTPWPASPLNNNQTEFGGQALRYLQELVDYIKPFIEENYLVKKGAEHTAIGGSSLGGLVSVFASYLHPDIFGKYIIISPSLWFEDVLNYIEGKTIIKLNKSYIKPQIDRSFHQIFLYTGALEGIYKNSPQKKMKNNAAIAYEYFLTEGCHSDCTKLIIDPEGTHDYLFFSKYFIEALKWIYKK